MRPIRSYEERERALRLMEQFWEAGLNFDECLEDDLFNVLDRLVENKLLDGFEHTFVPRVEPIRSHEEHERALRLIEQFWSAEEESLEGDLLDMIGTLILNYADIHFPIDATMCQE